MKYWWPFIISLSLYMWYKLFKAVSEYPKDILWQNDDEAEKNEM